MRYTVYDKATRRVIKTGIAAEDDCAAQVDDPATQAIITAPDDEQIQSLQQANGIQ